jgi:hypothetical protein
MYVQSMCQLLPYKLLDINGLGDLDFGRRTYFAFLSEKKIRLAGPLLWPAPCTLRG